MAHLKKRAAITIALFAGSLFVSQPTEARRFRFIPIPHIGGSRHSETIDLAYDLPDTDAYRRENSYANLGYLHGFSKQGFVLYSGKRYTLLTDSELDQLKTELGFDPTTNYRTNHAADFEKLKAERAKKDEMIAQGRMIEKGVDESVEDYAARKQEFIRQIVAQGGTVTEAEGNEAATVDEPSVFTLEMKILCLIGLSALVFLLFIAVRGWGNRREADDYRSDEEEAFAGRHAPSAPSASAVQIAPKLGDTLSAPPPSLGAFGRKLA